MVDTVRTRSQLQTAFADNTAGNISAQNGRDLVVSSFGYVGTGTPGVNNDAVDTAGKGAYFDAGSLWFDTTNNVVWSCLSGATGAAKWIQVFPADVDLAVCNGRLSLSSSDPIGENLSSQSVYLLPYKGNRVKLWNGNNWITQIIPAGLSPLTLSAPFGIYSIFLNSSLVLSSTQWTQSSWNISSVGVTGSVATIVVTSNHGLSVGQMVGVSGQTGTLGTDAKNGLNGRMWTITSIPQTNQLTLQQDATGLTGTISGLVYGPSTPPALTYQDGVLVLGSDTTKRFLGTVMCLDPTQSGTFAVQNTPRQRMLWNYYNRVAHPLSANNFGAVWGTNTSWTYTTQAFRISAGDIRNRVEILVGYAEDCIKLTAMSMLSNTNNGGWGNTAIGEDTCIAASPSCISVPNYNSSGNTIESSVASVSKLPTVGYHYYAWLEQSMGAGTTTWRGSDVNVMTGINGLVFG